MVDQLEVVLFVEKRYIMGLTIRTEQG